jgi:hypothetical protein
MLKIAIFGVKIDWNGGVIGIGVHGLTVNFETGFHLSRKGPAPLFPINPCTQG